MPGDGASIGAEYSPLSLPLPLLSLRGLTSSAGPESVDAGSMDSLYGSVSPYGSLAEGPDGRGPRPRRKGRRRSFIKLWCGRESSSATGCCGRRGVDSREVPQLHYLSARLSGLRWCRNGTRGSGCCPAAELYPVGERGRGHWGRLRGFHSSCLATTHDRVTTLSLPFRNPNRANQ